MNEPTIMTKHEEKLLTLLDQKEWTELATEALMYLKMSAENYIKASHICHKFHEKYGYKNYIQWVKEYLGLGSTRGQQLLNVYNRFGSTTVSVVTHFQPETLFLLFAPSTPETAVQEAIEKTTNGETLTVKETKELIEVKKKLEEKERLLEAEKAMREKLEAEKKESDKIISKQNFKIDTLSHNWHNALDEKNALKEKNDILISDLENERAKKKEVVPPADYEGLKAQAEKLKNQIKNLKERQEKEINSQVNRKLNELEPEIKRREGQLKSILGRVEVLQPQLNELEGKVSDLAKSKEVFKKFRTLLYDMSHLLEVFFADYTLPEAMEKDFKYLSSEMMKGAVAFQNYLDDKNPFQLMEN